jgi:hypothetical protein
MATLAAQKSSGRTLLFACDLYSLSGRGTCLVYL